MKRIITAALAIMGLILNVCTTATAQTDGTYFLKTQDGRFLARGNNWGTRAIMDEWGLPININTDANGISTLQFADTKLYLFCTGWNAYTDWNSNQGETSLNWTLTLSNGAYRLSSVLQEGKYTKADDGNNNIFTDGNGTNGTILEWTLQTPAEHAAEMAAKKAELYTLSSSINGLASKTYLEQSPTATAEQYQGSGNVMKGTIDITAPGIYKFSIQAFHRMASNDVAYALHTANADCPPVYAYFGDKKVQLASVFDEATTGNTGFSIDGKNYPNGQGGALTAFKEGRYQNTIWIRIGESDLGTYEYGITNQGAPGNNSHWTCYATDGIELTRYYDPATDGLDEQDQLLASLRYTIGDVNEDGTVSIADVTALVNIILGKADSYKAYLADVNEDCAVSIADVTALVNIILGKAQAKTVDLTYRYADLDAMVYAEQSATENAAGADYALNTATCTLTGDDVSAHYDIRDHLTTLNISTTRTDIANVSIYALGKQSIAGPMTVSQRGDDATRTYPAGQALTYASSQESDVVTVTGTATTYTAYLHPIDLPQGVKVTLRTTSGQYISQDFPTIAAGQVNNLTFTQTAAQNLWMATLPGNIPFTFLSIPGAHDAATKGMSANTTECQSMSISDLLAAGVRSLDLRPYATSSTTADNMYIYHGSSKSSVLFKTALSDVATFLDSHPTETVFILIHEEDDNNLDAWRNAVLACLENVSSYIKPIDNNMPLDNCRGKMVIISRDNVAATNLCGKCGWGSSFNPKTVFKGNDSNGTTPWTLYYQDEYAYSSNYKTTRIANIEKLLTDYIAPNETNANYIFVNTTNVAYKLLNSGSYIRTTAPVVNQAFLNSSVFQNSTGRWGIISSDYIADSNYYCAELLRTIISQNYKYAYRGRSRTE